MQPPRLRNAVCRASVVTHGAPPPPPSCSSLPDERRLSPGGMFFLKDKVTFTTPPVAFSFPRGAWCRRIHNSVFETSRVAPGYHAGGSKR